MNPDALIYDCTVRVIVRAQPAELVRLELTNIFVTFPIVLGKIEKSALAIEFPILELANIFISIP